MFVLKALFCILGALSYSNGDDTEVRRKFCPPMNNVENPRNRFDSSRRISRLREEMGKVTTVQMPPLDAYIVTRYDAHQNEFIADRDKRLEYLTGFTGGYGLAVVTKTKAAFWTDEVHSIQANNELSCDWILMKSNTPGILSPTSWLLQEMKSGGRIGADPKLVPNTEWEMIEKVLINVSVNFFTVNNNLIDVIWSEGKPEYPNSQAYVWPVEYAGQTWREKLEMLRNQIRDAYDAVILTSLSEIAWLFNIRAADVPYSPFLRAYAVISKDQVHLYTNTSKLTETVELQLATKSCVSSTCVRVHEYDLIWGELKSISKSWKRVLLPSMNHFSPGVSRAIYLLVWADRRRHKPSPLIPLIAQKNDEERIGMRKAHIRDAAIFCAVMAYLESEMEKNKTTWDEMYIVNVTDQYHLNNILCRGISYPTMVATGPNTGIPQYVPNNNTNIIMDDNNWLIIDVGAHYSDGTTSVARTFHLKEPTMEEIDLYTRVLMGFIDLAMLSFPQSLSADQMDVISKRPLWMAGHDYPHNSGHGIGTFLDVHQSPIVLDYRIKSDDILKDGYFVKSEIGYYVEESFGMKLGSVLEVAFKNDSLHGYLGFQCLTLVPFETKLINITMLSLEQKLWLNEYNKNIRAVIGDELLKMSQNNGYNWMVDRTEEIIIELEPDENRSFTLISKPYLIILSSLFPMLLVIS